MMSRKAFHAPRRRLTAVGLPEIVDGAPKVKRRAGKAALQYVPAVARVDPLGFTLDQDKQRP